MSEAGKELGEFVKELRESKYENFVLKVLPALRENKEVDNITEGCCSFSVSTKTYGVIDIFPKANKIRIRRQNKWIKPIMPWLNKYILKPCIN